MIEMELDLRAHQHLVDLAHGGSQNRLGEEGRAIGDHSEHQLQKERRHGRAFGIMEEVARLPVIFASLRRQHAVIGSERQDIFDDGAGFGDGPLAIGQDRRLAERVNGFQRIRRPHIGLAFIAHHLIVEAELFQEPQDALGP